MPLQSRALKAVGQAAESGEDHPLETCGLPTYELRCSINPEQSLRGWTGLKQLDA